MEGRLESSTIEINPTMDCLVELTRERRHPFGVLDVEVQIWVTRDM